MSTTITCIEEGKDYIVDDEEELPYISQDALGSGSCGVISKVKVTKTGEVFACRRIFVGSVRRVRGQMRKVFDNEISIIRSLEGHRHVVQVFATWTSRKYLGLLLLPVADQGNLEEYLERYLESEPNDVKEMEEDVLFRAFGCLAGGLAFMHQQKIRHKDVKPSNILIHQGRVVYTDFGYSLDSSERGSSTTAGLSDTFTRRYAAPEVLNNQKRNSRSDIFSLGCVFLDILVALSGAFDASSEEYVSTRVEMAHDEIDNATTSMPPSLRFLGRMIISMTMLDPERRCTAAVAAEFLLGKPDFCCNLCQRVPVPPRQSREEVRCGLNGLQHHIQAINLELNLLFDQYCLLLNQQFKQETCSTLDDNSALQDIPSLEDQLEAKQFLIFYSKILSEVSSLESALQKVLISFISDELEEASQSLVTNHADHSFHPIYRNRHAYVSIWLYTNLWTSGLNQNRYSMAFDDPIPTHVRLSPITLQVWADNNEIDHGGSSNGSNDYLIASPDPQDQLNHSLHHQKVFDSTSPSSGAPLQDPVSFCDPNIPAVSLYSPLDPASPSSCASLQDLISSAYCEIPAVSPYPPRLVIDALSVASRDPGNDEVAYNSTVEQHVADEGEIQRIRFPRARIQCLRTCEILTK